MGAREMNLTYHSGPQDADVGVVSGLIRAVIKLVTKPLSDL